MEFDLSQDQLEFLITSLKENLNGVPIDSLSDAYLEKLTEAMGTYMMTLSPLVSEIMKMTKEMSSVSIKGQSNLLTCKDFNQNEIISFLDNQKELKGFIRRNVHQGFTLCSPLSVTGLLSTTPLL